MMRRNHWYYLFVGGTHMTYGCRQARLVMQPYAGASCLRRRSVTPPHVSQARQPKQEQTCRINKYISVLFYVNILNSETVKH